MAESINDDAFVCAHCHPSVVVRGDIVPGIHLAFNGGPDRDIPREHYALFHTRDLHTPFLIWPETMQRALDESGVGGWSQERQRLVDLFLVRPQAGYTLIQGCIDAGWDAACLWDDAVLHWFVSRMARRVNGEPL